MERRRFLKAGAASVVLALPLIKSTPAAFGNSAVSEEEVAAVTEEFIQTVGQKNIPQNFRYRITEAWRGLDEHWYIAYQPLLLKKDRMTGKIAPLNTLDVLRRLGLDNTLNSGLLGVTIPPHRDIEDGQTNTEDAFTVRSEIFQIGPPVLSYADSIRKVIEIGVPTSFGKDYGPYQVWRFQGTALQRWKEDGRIEPVLIGDAVARAGLIPEDALLEIPQLDLTQSREDPLSTCQVSDLTWRGRVSHYSEGGCVGCNSDRIMANGQRFNENAFTLAFMRLPLNTQVLVTNLDNGLNAKATVTDTGGFESLGRIADLSLGLANYLGVSTDQSSVEITKLNC